MLIVFCSHNNLDINMAVPICLYPSLYFVCFCLCKAVVPEKPDFEFMSPNVFLYLMILLLRGQPTQDFFVCTCFILWILVRHVVVISHLATLIALLGLHLQWKRPLLQIMDLMNLTSPVLRGHTEGEVKMTILTGNSLCYLSTRILLTANSSDSLF